MIEPAHDAEIDGDETALRVHEQVSRMHVGVEEAIAQGLREEGADQKHRDAFGIVTRRFQRSRIAQWCSVDPFRGQHALSRALPVDFGHTKIAIGAGPFGELRCGGGLHAKIEFDSDGLRQRVDHGRCAQTSALGGEPLDKTCSQREG